jgi:hypothetical protein
MQEGGKLANARLAAITSTSAPLDGRAANIPLTIAIHLAQALNLHDERAIEGVADGIEREVRRRLFWLLCEFTI